MEKSKQVSKCCKAIFHVEGSDEGTNHYECDKCGQSTDPFIPQSEAKCNCKHDKYPWDRLCTCDCHGTDVVGTAIDEIHLNFSKSSVEDWAAEFEDGCFRGYPAKYKRFLIPFIKNLLISQEKKVRQSVLEEVREMKEYVSTTEVIELHLVEKLPLAEILYRKSDVIKLLTKEENK